MVRITAILVPTDFSADADAALEHAIDFAKLFGARIHLLHAYYIVPQAATPWSYSFPAGLIDQVRQDAQRRVEELRDKVKARGVEASCEISGEPPSLAIIASAERQKADLIAMGTRGLTGVKHVLLGSVAERTLRHAPCPVLTVKAAS
jgi:nucleotide-binding universal stress UspA family protein